MGRERETGLVLHVGVRCIMVSYKMGALLRPERETVTGPPQGVPPVLRMEYGGQERCVQTKIGTYRRNEQ